MLLCHFYFKLSFILFFSPFRKDQVLDYPKFPAQVPLNSPFSSTVLLEGSKTFGQNEPP